MNIFNETAKPIYISSMRRIRAHTNDNKAWPGSGPTLSSLKLNRGLFTLPLLLDHSGLERFGGRFIDQSSKRQVIRMGDIIIMF